MKIYSWNVLFQNKRFDAAFDFIKNLDFDVLALQEVPEQFLERLKTLPLNIRYDVDWDRLFPKEAERNYLVILTPHEIVSEGTIAIPDYQYPLRTRAFIRLMRTFHFAKLVNRHGFYADLQMKGELSLRVFCLHLTLANPSLRMSELEQMMTYLHETAPSIVCGDFNILESYKVSLLSWLLAGKVSDVFAVRRERRVMEEKFNSYKLKNPLRRFITHPFSRSQLDHILVPKPFEVTAVAVLPDPVGSDHHPVFVEGNIACE